MRSARNSTAYALCVIFALFVALVACAWAKDSSDRQPEISGMTQGNTGCAVLDKHEPVKGKLLVVGVVYARTQYVVLDSFNCKLPKDKYTGPGDVKELNQYAINNKIKLVVIHHNYSDQELQDAKNICGQPSSSRPSAGSNAP